MKRPKLEAHRLRTVGRPADYEIGGGGMVTTTLAPTRPSSVDRLRAATVPPCAIAMALTMARPRPAPSPSTPRTNGSNALVRTSGAKPGPVSVTRSEEHTSELQSREKLVCRLLLE